MIILKNRKQGLSLIEVVIASAIVSIVMISLVSAYNIYLKVSLETTNSLKATFLLEETIEATRFLRDTSWGNLSSLNTGTNYYLYFDDTSGFEATTTVYLIDDFSRVFSISDVSRDSNNDISVIGTNDPNTKKITGSVFWLNHGTTTTKILESYITNIFE